jgi:transposase
VKLAAELEPVQHFQSVSQFDAFYGLSPVNCTSGSSVHRKTKMSKQGSARVRKALYMPAIAAKRCNPMVRDLCNRLSSKKLASMAIIVAAMRKLLHQVFGVLKTGRPFDPNYVASRS